MMLDFAVQSTTCCGNSGGGPWTGVLGGVPDQQIQGIILPDLSVVFGLTGGFCGGLVTFAFPAMFYIRVASKKGERRLNSALACFSEKG